MTPAVMPLKTVKLGQELTGVHVFNVRYLNKEGKRCQISWHYISN